MKIKFPYNWDPDLLEPLADLGITRLYGKATVDPTGGGRPAALLPDVDVETALAQIEVARRSGFSFEYLLNDASRVELDATARAEVEVLLGQLTDSGVTSVTVATPATARLVALAAPAMRLTVSAFAFVESPDQLRQWEDLGAAAVVLYEHRVNRDFGQLRALRGATSLELVVVANNGCLLDCPTARAHAASMGCASRADRDTPFVDHHFLQCRSTLLRDPIEAVRAPWIRPEDVHHYEALGIDAIKLVDRMLPTRDLLRIAGAYTARRYEGDLIDLVPALRGFAVPTQSGVRAQDLLEGDSPSLDRLGARLETPALRIDNRALDGFLEPFTRGLSPRCPDARAHCRTAAERAVIVDETLRRQHLSLLSAVP